MRRYGSNRVSVLRPAYKSYNPYRRTQTYNRYENNKGAVGGYRSGRQNAGYDAGYVADDGYKRGGYDESYDKRDTGYVASSGYDGGRVSGYDDNGYDSNYVDRSRSSYDNAGPAYVKGSGRSGYPTY